LKPVFLVGLMGSGKTTVGRMLARRLKARFIDSDHEIEARSGVSITTIFEIEGEEGFRRREVGVIEDLTQQEDIVLATGGGAILDPANRSLLHERGITVYLSATPYILYERTRNDRTRPLLQVDDRLGKLRDLHAQRDPLYREVAHVIVEVGHAQASSVVRNILQAIGNS
jgi:shikimate kinase